MIDYLGFFGGLMLVIFAQVFLHPNSHIYWLAMVLGVSTMILSSARILVLSDGNP